MYSHASKIKTHKKNKNNGAAFGKCEAIKSLSVYVNSPTYTNRKTVNASSWC